ncbi:hypothetical protein J19TS2_59000 [Cohnella xylanilytica]|uniref:DUF6155 family protein n=1 Tax=Cohnella xylanilytica TaxID=557555 RepID=UPI001B12A639|nr:DUF6155 family protein [Cohnella xylanilytica]GIO16345.1 hypothetical protein J19TS2_59000 [Cohnella xylanilytica]
MNYLCRIELEDTEPKIWRTFAFDPDITFHQLHQIVQTVMGWTDTHLYEFEVGNRSFEGPDLEFGDGEGMSGNAVKATVSTYWKPIIGSAIRYMYDFGDGWEHTIVLTETADEAEAPVCLDGERRCPPEDVGGAWRYTELLEALADPASPDRKSFMRWIDDPDFDPGTFSVDEVNELLRNNRDAFIPKTGRKRGKAATGPDKPVKLTKAALKKHLNQLDEEQLAELVLECFGISKDVQRYLEVKLFGDAAAERLFAECRKKVVDEFFPERGQPKLRLKEAKKAISDFKKLTGDERRTLELNVVYVECGVKFARDYGVQYDSFFNSVSSVFADVVSAISASGSEALFKEYVERLEGIIDDSEHTWWGFYEDLYAAYSELKRDEN